MQNNLSDCTTRRKLLVSGKNPWNGQYNDWEQNCGFVVFDHIRDVILSRPWSSIVWQNGRRLEKNFISSDWLVLDYDEHVLTLDQAKKNFCDYQNIISVTRSHTENCHHLRVCIPWSEQITDVELFKYNFRKNAEFYGSDLRALTAARFFWPSKGIYSVNTEGDQMEVMPLFKTADDFQFIKLNDVPPEQRELPFYYESYLRDGLDHCRTGRNQPLWGLSMDLFKEGYSEDEILELISRVKCRPSYSADEYRKCVRSAKKAVQKTQKRTSHTSSN